MLDVAKIIRQSNNREFDTVVFFDRDELHAFYEALKRDSWRARMFPEDFVDISVTERSRGGRGRN